jgi:hypothetical protein
MQAQALRAQVAPPAKAVMRAGALRVREERLAKEDTRAGAPAAPEQISFLAATASRRALPDPGGFEGLVSRACGRGGPNVLEHHLVANAPALGGVADAA